MTSRSSRSTTATNGPTRIFAIGQTTPWNASAKSLRTTKMPKAGDVVIVNFVGATGVKRRPAVVLSSDSYHAQRPDAVLAAITTNVVAATASTDHVLVDWKSAGLFKPSAFRAYFAMGRQ